MLTIIIMLYIISLLLIYLITGSSMVLSVLLKITFLLLEMFNCAHSLIYLHQNHPVSNSCLFLVLAWEERWWKMCDHSWCSVCDPLSTVFVPLATITGLCSLTASRAGQTTVSISHALWGRNKTLRVDWFPCARCSWNYVSRMSQRFSMVIIPLPIHK